MQREEGECRGGYVQGRRSHPKPAGLHTPTQQRRRPQRGEGKKRCDSHVQCGLSWAWPPPPHTRAVFLLLVFDFVLCLSAAVFYLFFFKFAPSLSSSFHLKGICIPLPPSNLPLSISFSCPTSCPSIHCHLCSPSHKKPKSDTFPLLFSAQHSSHLSSPLPNTISFPSSRFRPYKPGGLQHRTSSPIHHCIVSPGLLRLLALLLLSSTQRGQELQLSAAHCLI